jgi:hypothetical protein
MKKALLFVVSAVIMFSVFSCSEKKATNLEELKKKYDGKEFKDCDAFIAAAEEMIEVYFATIDKAVEGDEKAKKDVEDFEKFMEDFEDQSEKFEEECPDKFKAFEEKFEKKMEEYMPKIMKLYGLEDMFEEMEGEDWTDVEEELVEEVTE